MEVGAHVWLRSETSQWGWVPAKITSKSDSHVGKVPVINLTLTDDPLFESGEEGSDDNTLFDTHQKFEVVVTVDPEQLKTADHDDIKLRNLSRSYQLKSSDPFNSIVRFLTSRSSGVDDTPVGGVDDLIGLTHLHEPAILHALLLRYKSDIIYTSTGPILIAINPFKDMPLYSEQVMERYRLRGESGGSGVAKTTETPFKRRTNDSLLKKLNPESGEGRLPPHAYQTADGAYRAMMRGLENNLLMSGSSRKRMRELEKMPTNQSILVSGESGAGKTVTTKIVLNYLAMLSKIAQRKSGVNSSFRSPEEDVSIEQQVLQSNPILESFGNARTMRNDNSSRFGKYIDIRFTKAGKLIGASIETYLLEKVRLIRPSTGERNYHIFYQFLSSATTKEREQFYLDDLRESDFKLLSNSGIYDRRDGVSDKVCHQEMLEAMVSLYLLFVK